MTTTRSVAVPQTNDDTSLGTVLYGRRFDDGSPVLASPFHADGSVDVTAVLGRPGSGKSFWLTSHARQLAAVDVPLLAIDPLGDLRELFAALGARTVTLGAGSAQHVNPFRRSSYGVGVDLRPVFAVLLGDAFTGEAEALLASATVGFYADPDAPEQALDGFIEALEALEFADGAVAWATRDDLATRLRAIGEDPILAELLAHVTDVDLALEPGVPLRIEFSHDVFADDEGRMRALSMLAAFGLARTVGLSSVEPKMLLVNDLDVLLRSRDYAMPLAESFADLLRVHRHGATAVTFALALGMEDGDSELTHRGLIKQAHSFILLRATEAAVRVAAELAGVDTETVIAVLTPDPGDRGSPRESRPAVFVHDGVAKAIRVVVA